MMTVALVGGDGSGKSTLADALAHNLPAPTSYIYMGTSLESSNYLLPWSRLTLKLKIRRIAQSAKEQGISDPEYLSTSHMSHRQRSGSALRATISLSNRLLEAAYRNVIAKRLERQGNIVIFDRHFLFDVVLSDEPFRAASNREKVARVYSWIVANVLPQPDLILFLDTDAEVMFERKGETSVEYLRHRNDHWRKQGAGFDSFVALDGNQPAEQVFKDASDTIVAYLEKNELASPTAR